MPYRWIDPEVFSRRGEICVYRTYRHDLEDDPYEYTYTTDRHDPDRCSFDVRAIGYPEPVMKNNVDHRKVIQWALKNKKLKLPEGITYAKDS